VPEGIGDSAGAPTAEATGVAAPAAPPASPASPSPAPAGLAAIPPRWLAFGALVLCVATTASLVLAWNTQQRVKLLESELVRRQQDSDKQATEARTLARQAEVAAREAVAKLALVEARISESALQRSQFEELIQSLARSRDDNVLADIETALRVAQQQAVVTGSAEPLVLALKQAEERLTRLNQPRLERVRRAVVQDLDRTRARAGADLALLGIRIDEAVRTIDELPLLADVPQAQAEAAPPAPGEAATPAAAPPSPAGWWSRAWQLVGHIGAEARSLVRVTRVERVEPLLLAPEQAFFLRENLKLRLLNARLALLSRQFETAQTDLREAQVALARWFDTGQRRVVVTQELLRSVAAQARQVELPRPDATFAAITAAGAGR
jgi:uroporphyrin-3 C-methyltransferase